jgi:replicative DNA helicase
MAQETHLFKSVMNHLRSAQDLLLEFQNTHHKRNSVPNADTVQLAFIKTGFTELDALTGGLNSQDLIVLAGRPESGKSSLALNIVEQVCFPPIGTPIPVLIFSLEMSSDQLISRMICSRARVALNRLKSDSLTQDEQARISGVAKELQNAPIWIDDTGHATIEDLNEKVRDMHARYGLGLIVVDYLELVSGTVWRNRNNQISEIMEGLKAVGKEQNIPILILSQMTRVFEKENRQPQLTDLHDSTSIVEHADLILLLDKDPNAQKPEILDQNAAQMRELIVAKNPRGPTGVVPLTFFRQYVRFE